MKVADFNVLKRIISESKGLGIRSVVVIGENQHYTQIFRELVAYIDSLEIIPWFFKIPILKEFNGGEGFFEGCLLLSKETIFVADTERHSYPFIREFISDILNDFKEVIYARIPKARRYMHPDTFLTGSGKTLHLLIFLPLRKSACLRRFD